MPKSPDTPYSFLSGCVQNRNKARVIAQIDELKAAGSTASQLMTWGRETNEWLAFELGWHATRICMAEEPELRLIATGPDGIVVEITKAGPQPEVTIDHSDEGPRRRGPIRDLRWIGDHAFAAGMGRQVYRRESEGQWTRCDDGVVQELGAIEVSGFNSIDGLLETSVYGVGFSGEIWHRRDGTWQKCSSPTNVVLHRVKVVNNDLVYASGQLGVLLRGSEGNWESLQHESTEADLWGLEWFKDRLYVACDTGLFVLTPDEGLEPVDLGLGKKVTCRHLHTSDGLLWSSGPKHVCWSEDGKNWIDVTP